MAGRPAGFTPPPDIFFGVDLTRHILFLYNAPVSLTMTMQTTTHTIRWSGVPTHARCPRRSVGRILGFRKQPTGKIKLTSQWEREWQNTIAAAFGTVCHAIISDALTEGWAEDRNDYLREKIGYFWNEQMRDQKILWDTKTPDLNAAHFQTGVALRMMFKYLENEADIGTLQAVEEKMTADLEDGFAMSGTVDLIINETVVDWKTGAALQIYPPQLAGYADLAKRNGYTVSELRHIWIPRGKDEIKMFVYPLDEANKNHAALLLDAIVGDLKKAGDPQKDNCLAKIIPNVHDSLCGDKYCDLFGSSLCREGAAAKGVNAVPYTGEEKQ